MGDNISYLGDIVIGDLRKILTKSSNVGLFQEALEISSEDTVSWIRTLKV